MRSNQAALLLAAAISVASTTHRAEAVRPERSEDGRLPTVAAKTRGFDPVNALLFATPRGVSALLEELFDIEPPSMSNVAQRTVTPTGLLGPVRITGRWLPDHGYELELVLKFR